MSELCVALERLTFVVSLQKLNGCGCRRVRVCSGLNLDATLEEEHEVRLVLRSVQIAGVLLQVARSRIRVSEAFACCALAAAQDGALALVLHRWPEFLDVRSWAIVPKSGVCLQTCSGSVLRRDVVKDRHILALRIEN